MTKTQLQKNMENNIQLAFHCFLKGNYNEMLVYYGKMKCLHEILYLNYKGFSSDTFYTFWSVLLVKVDMPIEDFEENFKNFMRRVEGMLNG